MSRFISDIEPKVIDDHLMKYEYSVYLMNSAVTIGVALNGIENCPNEMKEQYQATKQAFEILRKSLIEYREAQKQALIKCMEDKS